MLAMEASRLAARFQIKQILNFRWRSGGSRAACRSLVIGKRMRSTTNHCSFSIGTLTMVMDARHSVLDDLSRDTQLLAMEASK